MPSAQAVMISSVSSSCWTNSFAARFVIPVLAPMPMMALPPVERAKRSMLEDLGSSARRHR
jgi:hypothetical protein